MLDAAHWPGIPLHLSIDRDVSSRDKSKQIKIRFKEMEKAEVVRYILECLLGIRDYKISEMSIL